MRVRDRLVAVGVRVFPARRRVVVVVVMPVIVTMRVLVLDGFVRMRVLVRFRQMQENPHGAKQTAENRGKAGGALAERPSESSAEKRSHREYRSRSGRTDHALRSQIEPQARAVT